MASSTSLPFYIFTDITHPEMGKDLPCDTAGQSGLRTSSAVLKTNGMCLFKKFKKISI